MNTDNLQELYREEESTYTQGDFPRAAKLRAERMKRERKDDFYGNW